MRNVIGTRLAPVRDCLRLFFFLALGAGLDLSGLGAQLGAAAVLSVFVLVGNPLIVLAIMGWMGDRERTGFLVGLTVAQISEHTLIYMAMGVALDHAAPEAMALVTLVGLVTIARSVCMISPSHRLHPWCEPWLGVFERRHPFRAPAEDGPQAGAQGHDVLVLGLGRFGRLIGQGLAARGLRPLGVDFDPAALRDWRELGFHGVFGDASDPGTLAHLRLKAVRAVVSALPRQRGAPARGRCPCGAARGAA